MACEQPVSEPISDPTPAVKTPPPTPIQKTKKDFKVGLLNEETIDMYGGTALFDEKKQGMIAYVNERNKAGGIMIDGKLHFLQKVSSNNGSYLFMGKDIEITTTQAQFDDTVEGDCFYGDFKEITVTYQGIAKNFSAIQVQDCGSAGM